MGWDLVRPFTYLHYIHLPLQRSLSCLSKCLNKRFLEILSGACLGHNTVQTANLSNRVATINLATSIIPLAPQQWLCTGKSSLHYDAKSWNKRKSLVWNHWSWKERTRANKLSWLHSMHEWKRYTIVLDDSSTLRMVCDDSIVLI